MLNTSLLYFYVVVLVSRNGGAIASAITVVVYLVGSKR